MAIPKSSQHRTLGDLSAVSCKPETATSDFAQASSITLIIHGVGNTTDEKLLTAAANGYYQSGLGAISERLTLSECPTLSGKKCAGSLVLQGTGGPHFLVALPWAERRIRLSNIAKWSAVALLVLAALATASFLFRRPLESLADWLEPRSHFLVAYLVLMALSYFGHVLNPSTAKREFERPSVLILFLPLVLIIGLELFVKGTWLWIPVALLVVILWLMSTVIVSRCLRIAQTLDWRIALATLIVALALPGSALLRVAWHFAVRSAKAPRAESADRHIPYGARPAEWLQGLSSPIRQEQGNANADSRGSSSPRTRASHRTAHDYLRDFERKDPLKLSPYNKDSLDPLIGDRGAYLREHEALTKALSAQLTPKPLKFSDLVSANELVTALSVVAICVALCLLAMAFNWLVDFGLDVLNYVGHEKLRASLIAGTVRTIRWFHDQAPATPIIVVGHSLGSVIASHAIGSLPALEPCLGKIVLVTLGSPLNYLNRAFPDSVQEARGLSQAICARVRWINLWRRYDLVGKGLNIETIGTVQYCVGSGGHPNYWSDGAVWRAVAREALGVSDGTERQTLSTRGTCLFELWLGPLVFAVIAVIALCGAGLWAITL